MKALTKIFACVGRMGMGSGFMEGMVSEVVGHTLFALGAVSLVISEIGVGLTGANEGSIPFIPGGGLTRRFLHHSIQIASAFVRKYVGLLL